MHKYQIKKITELYDKRVLTPELGQADVKQKLLLGLERVLKEVDVSTQSTDFQAQLVLDRDIDYQSIFRTAIELGHSHCATRLRTEFRNGDIRTYRDIVDSAKDYIKKREHIPKSRGVRLLHFRKGGIVGIYINSLQVLYSHLNSLGIQLFPDGYTPRELGKG